LPSLGHKILHHAFKQIIFHHAHFDTFVEIHSGTNL
jgi:hypothetical protein